MRNLNVDLLVANIESEQAWREKNGRPALTPEEQDAMWLNAMKLGNISQELRNASQKDRNDHQLYQ